MCPPLISVQIYGLIFLLLQPVLGSVQVELGAYDDFYLLVERAGAAQAEFVYVPIDTDDRLLCHDLFIKKFNAARHAYWQIVLILN